MSDGWFTSYNAKFWKQSLERAVKSAAQSALLALVGLNTALEASGVQVDAWNADWRAVAGFGAGGFVLSLLTSVASEPFGPTSDPSTIR